ncbi:MAG: iron ABC transporter substrate-binding protein [Acidimicrobiia bacterium]
MTSRRPLAVVPALVLALALVTAGCTGSSGDTLTVYSGRTENLIGPLLEQYADDTGVDIDVRYGQSADLALLVEQEGDKSPADVFISQSPGALGFLEAEGRLRELSAETLDLVDADYRDPDGEWVGLSGRVRVLVYNSDAVGEDELPASVFDLVDEEYAGRVGVAPENGSFQDFVSAMREVVGDDETAAWLEGMADNGSPTYANNTAIVEAVARGEVDMGLVNHYYNERARAENPDTPTENHFFPGGDLGTLVLVTGAGIIDTAPHPDDAEDLVAFLLGEGAQQFFAAETYEYPLAAGVEPTVDLPPLSGIEAPPVTLGVLGGDLAATREMISDSGLGAG